MQLTVPNLVPDLAPEHTQQHKQSITITLIIKIAKIHKILPIPPRPVLQLCNFPHKLFHGETIVYIRYIFVTF